MHLPGSSPVSSAFPTLMSGRLPASFRERDFSRGKFSRLQLFRYVQASELACLPDRSYRCRFPRRAAEAFTSEQNVRRCLRTHRICSPPDYRQLAARGLPPREIHSIVDCSISDFPQHIPAYRIPVSYTHLDVYKRQFLKSLGIAATQEGVGGLLKVDVLLLHAQGERCV